MAAPQAWSSHIWTEQTLTRLISSDQQQVEIRTNERMPQSFMVPRSLLKHYCPKLQPSTTLLKHIYVLETSRALLTLFFGWLYTGKVDTTSWYDLTELYFLGHAAGSVALMRCSISQLQKACRDDQRNDTDLFHYGHISVIEEMVGTSSPLSRYVEDTYFNHWDPSDDDGVSDDPSQYPKSNAFFKKLFQRSRVEQREGENCSCCHDYCKYHDHHSEEERLATCGRLSAPMAGPSTDVPNSADQQASAPVVKPAATPTVKSGPARVAKPDPLVRRSRNSKSVRRSMINELASERDDSVLHETRASASRDGTPKVKTADDTWLTVMSRAPVGYPADYHGLLMSLPQVQLIKPLDWLESGLNAEGIDQLPEPDRIIAAAMSWNAEDYAQTKCNFFNQYDPTIQDQSRWLRILKFGGSKPKEKGERLLAMWSSLGWLKTPDAVVNNGKQHQTVLTAPKARIQTPRGAKLVESVEEKDASSRRCVSWAFEEEDAMIRIMDALERDPNHANLSTPQRADVCRLRLRSQFATDRTSVAILIRYRKHRRDQETVQNSEDNNTTTNSATGRSLHNALLNVPLATRPRGMEFTAINDPLDRAVTSDDRVDSAAPSSTNEVQKKAERWTAAEDKAMLEIFKEFEEDPDLSVLNERERSALCSARLLSKHDIERGVNGVKQRWRRLNSSNNTPAKRKGEENDEFDDESEPLMNRQKRRQTGSRFVPEFYDAGEE